ncbi:MAG: hypothetical protein GY889_16660 [Proteobacteria bacterium]|nr:hypothetical protein [Pseudomonadota bacterium]
MRYSLLTTLTLTTACLLSGCVTSTVDEMIYNEPVEGIGESSVVILGRRHSSNYETEPDFVLCVGEHITSYDNSITVIGELEFINALYPWFEPRTAPLHPEGLEQLVLQEPVARKIADLKLEYIIWLDGSTERSGGSGSMACSLGGCFGFGTWAHDANYEATIWDFSDRAAVGHISTSASGQSYMPAVIVPIPIIAPVQGTACDGVGDQLLEFLSSEY